MKINNKIDEIKYFNEICELDKKLAHITSKISKQYPKPINSKEQKNIFFEYVRKNKIYNPQVKYERREIPQEVLIELENLKKSISLKNDLFNLKKLLIEKIKEGILTLKMYKYWGTTQSSKYCVKCKGYPSKEDFQNAIEFTKNYKRSKIKFKRITPQKLGLELQNEVLRLTGEHIETIFKPLANKVVIRAKHNQIIINPEESFKTIDVQRLKVHEIQTHYMRFYNSKKIPIEMFHSGTSHYILTEEGLAVYMEYIHNVLSQAQLFIYAGRVIATYLCLTMSFFEIFTYLKNLGFKEEDAYKITFRAKRNLNDTSKKGGYTKDYVYFVGFHKIKKHLEEYPQDFEKLFIGKIKVEDLELLKKFISKYKKGEIIFN